MMPNKKRILRNMALIGLAVFVISGLSLLITERMSRLAEIEFEKAWNKTREDRILKYRSYLQETAKKVVKLPVDPNIAGRAEAHYFEEYSNARLYLWAMDTGGKFQFGVPREPFDRLNRAYDTYQKLIVQEGRFTDRQDFIRRLVRDQRNMNFGYYEAKTAGQEGSERRRQEEDGGPHESDGLVFSAPYQNDAGEMLGTLYLKVSDINDDRGYFRNGYQGPQELSGILLAASALFLWFLLPTWVYLDAKGRGVDSPVLWSVLTLVSLVFGLAIYLILRPEQGTKGVCQNCGRTTGGEKYCPYCGSPATSDFCPKCGYPARAEWTYCPNCQTAIQKIPEPAPHTVQEPAIEPGPQA